MIAMDNIAAMTPGAVDPPKRAEVNR
jgi:hypothetical protein